MYVSLKPPLDALVACTLLLLESVIFAYFGLQQHAVRVIL